MIVDSHCHLNYFDPSEIKDVVLRAEENNVKLMQTVCTTIAEFSDLVKVAESYKQVYLSVGVHPTNSANGESVSVDELVDLAQHSKVIGLGETGLDFYKCSQVGEQEKNFLSHINASRETGLPVIIHSRNADKRMMEILESEMKESPFLGLMHCFASSRELAIKAIELGLYISFSGIVTFKSAKVVQEVAGFIPKDRVLVETDSPFLSPEPYRGQRNEPAKTKFVVEYLANLWNESLEEVSNLTTKNFFKLFKKCSEHFHL
ncbi:hydrolase, TatD family protein [Ehrlichia chaffeensis str. Heartland]|uniref:Hydrolase, TatD family n=1 Tax=Ehrlichia chaffeensis (strain ATCC CRL-10679 / Arkansas) TaxID=205920 RepID=Q2GG42_EHRCR|nr:TatD family hydrolase [Ehrlichia chaffeensis]ABD45047.1 hydrolase, TatD family [Ehrlichia chaffeensis str. Arkansas]AHX03850.1 hydrolase, TatD family protein [Ehrlichia chaffeensis str. Heartland]AHX07249.1 hydrolase, TatD family protein [Ehrlichia chaffeensis str. Osceola]AHX09946.1 hydrolase, TatD family protein [Ehrlichia chaffeensis str. Wakulla]AHX10415.1 hydrolase, TatD family protein [Ehrlichia chaffeensis str. West Paces]